MEKKKPETKIIHLIHSPEKEKAVSLAWLERWCKRNKFTPLGVEQWEEFVSKQKLKEGKYVLISDLLTAARKKAKAGGK